MTPRIVGTFLLATAAWAQTICPPTPRFTPCDIVFNLPGVDPANPPDIHVEIRSPRHETVRANGFWDGGNRWVARFTPDEAGPHSYRVTGPGEVNGKEGQLTATESGRKGWLRAANLHHFALVDGNTLTPHLWMGFVALNFNSPAATAAWKGLIDRRASQHFNHVAITLVDESVASTFQSPAFFQSVEEKIAYANGKGLIVDVAFFGPNGLMTRLLPQRAAREKWFANAMARLAPYDVTWQGLEAWESYENGRSLMKEFAGYLALSDAYKHTRSTRAQLTSAAMADDGWLRYRSYQTADENILIPEQLSFQYPAVNNFGAGVMDPNEFRRRLWNTTMFGHYPAVEVPNEDAANAMKVWYEFMVSTRHWELEPHFDVEGGRSVALEETEYIVYSEKPGPVTITVDKASYDVEWINPLTGAHTPVKEKTKTETLTFSPPDNAHDWILHVSREGRKAGMLKSYKFDSRQPPLALQDMEGNPEKVPFEIVAPEGDTLQVGQSAKFAIRMKRESKALRHVNFEWTGEVTVSERGFRVIGTGPQGTFNIPESIAGDYPAEIHIRLTGVNALGKVYFIDRNYQLKK